MKKTVLLIEDDPILRNRLAVTLREASYELLHATTDVDAGEQDCSPVPDLLLIDLDLRSAASWDIYAHWKARHPGLRTVAMTGVPNRFGVARAVGIDALMEKPVEPSLLLLVIANVVGESARSPSRRDTGSRFDFRYLTSADTRYWRGLRAHHARARHCRTAPLWD